MEKKPREHQELTRTIIGAAIEVHRTMGPGLLEPLYEWCLLNELSLSKLNTETQRIVTVHYKKFAREEPLRFDVLVEGKVLIEVKSVQAILPVHKAQLLSYMRLMKIPVGLLINFNTLRIVDDIHRLYLPKSAQEKNYKT